MIKENKVILILAEADRDGIGNKARHLARLLQCQPGLFSIPPGVVLLPDFSLDKDLEELRQSLNAISKGPFAVRSCGLEEDGINESMAGKFHTELFVSLENISEAILKVRASYGQRAATSALLIQQMVQPDYAGVLFSRSPENHGLASCEYSKGTADVVVSGKVEPARVDYGRWSGTLYPAQKDADQMLSLLFLVGMIIEEKMGAAQDIEWAYEKNQGKLYILQSRDITSNQYDPGIATEQERVADIAAATKNGQKGRVVLKNSAVREVVSSPTRLTRSLIERLYAPSGALGRAFKQLGLPIPKLNQAYILPVFGQLYANLEVERKLFGFQPRLLWTSRKLKRKIHKDPESLLSWLTQSIEAFPRYPVTLTHEHMEAAECARSVVTGARCFIEEVYPVAYAATLVAQMAGEENQEASLTSQLMRDLSRLHHTGETADFLAAWGKRSANDYELAEPRFCESPEHAVHYAANFASFPWGQVETGSGFTHVKELAKDRAVCWLYALRQNILALQSSLGLEPDMVFYLTLEDIEALAGGNLSSADIPALCQQRVHEEAHWSTVNLGDEITLEALERLHSKIHESQALRGKMVSVKIAFNGIARHVDSLKKHPLSGNEVIVSKYLEPGLTGYFPHSAACIADMGGVLSHAAIVARELDYPVLVLSGSSTTIRDGDEIKVTAEGFISITRKR